MSEPKSEKTEAAPESTSAIDFTGFVLSLAQTAAIDLGEAPHPDTGEVVTDLDAARQAIDILAMLQEKTAGNLSPREGKLIEGVLYQLRLSFVEHK